MPKILTIALFFTLLGSGSTVVEGAPKGNGNPNPAGKIVAVGDSLTAGYGLSQEEAYPALLARKLRETGYRYQVLNAGISGETSSGTLSRVRWILKLRPDIVILETGANDGMRGIAPELLEKNLDQIVATLKEQGVVVILAGMRMFPNLGKEYVEGFAQVFPRVAKKHDLILIPFFLAKVAGVPALTQPDGIHPTAAGYQTVTATVYPYVIKAIERRHPVR